MGVRSNRIVDQAVAWHCISPMLRWTGLARSAGWMGALAAAACGPPSGTVGARWRSWTRLARLPLGAAVGGCGDGLTWPRRPLGGPAPRAARFASLTAAVSVVGGSGGGYFANDLIGMSGVHAVFRAGAAVLRWTCLAAARGPPSGVAGARWRSRTDLAMRPFGAAVTSFGDGLTWPRLPLGGPVPWAAWATRETRGGGDYDGIDFRIKMITQLGKCSSRHHGRGRAGGSGAAARCRPPRWGTRTRWRS